ncbi:hypothetical protein C7388_107173 [Methylobacterium radiotolerans]|nr:hypothetical protein C7388_107173 [Methylobacterium organophilum]
MMGPLIQGASISGGSAWAARIRTLAEGEPCCSAGEPSRPFGRRIWSAPRPGSRSSAACACCSWPCSRARRRASRISRRSSPDLRSIAGPAGDRPRACIRAGRRRLSLRCGPARDPRGWARSGRAAGRGHHRTHAHVARPPTAPGRGSGEAAGAGPADRPAPTRLGPRPRAGSLHDGRDWRRGRRRPPDHRGAAAGGLATPGWDAAIADGDPHSCSAGRGLNRVRQSRRLAPPDPHRPSEVKTLCRTRPN